MTLAHRMVETLRAHRWRATAIASATDRVELHPLESKLGAGFTLWRRQPGGAWQVVASGHTESGALRAPEGERLQMSPTAWRALEALMAQA
ncbi:MAG: hypothetical protein QJR03_08165 [Sphaerobacter sp.]|nr:hypothetical protein [Sphaerobacter sp.]